MKAVKKFKVGESYDGYGDVKGITFTLLQRSGNLCLFNRSDGYYEVIRVKQRKKEERTINGRTFKIESGESYPYGSKWDGKCVKTLRRANEIFNSLL